MSHPAPDPPDPHQSDPTRARQPPQPWPAQPGQQPPTDPSWGLPPPPPPPVQPEGPPVNRFAIASLALGVLVPCCGGLLSVIFGIVALVQIRRTGQRGRGLAIGGFVATGVWVLVLAVVLVLVVANSGADRDHTGQISGPGRVPVDDLRPGDCVNGLDEGVVQSMPAVPCAEPHDGEVFGIFDLPAGDWPGDDEVFSQSETGCLEVLRGYSPTAYDDESVELYYLHPTQASWRQDDREVVCMTYYPDAPRTGSIRE
jgi:hypothetical protein